MEYRVKIEGDAPLLMHSGSRGLDPHSAENIEISELARKRGGNKTEDVYKRIRLLETKVGFWLDDAGYPTIPAGAFRAALEAAARKTKQGGQVREGLVVTAVERFAFPKSYGKTIDELAANPDIQFSAMVRVGQAGLMRTRPKFEEWGATFCVDCDDELVDKTSLAAWLDIAGRRIGIGDWRPAKSGQYGRFHVVKISRMR